jgi:hypothetical protein
VRVHEYGISGAEEHVDQEDGVVEEHEEDGGGVLGDWHHGEVVLDVHYVDSRAIGRRNCRRVYVRGASAVEGTVVELDCELQVLDIDTLELSGLLSAVTGAPSLFVMRVKDVFMTVLKW